MSPKESRVRVGFERIRNYFQERQNERIRKDIQAVHDTREQATVNLAHLILVSEDICAQWAGINGYTFNSRYNQEANISDIETTEEGYTLAGWLTFRVLKGNNQTDLGYIVLLSSTRSSYLLSDNYNLHWIYYGRQDNFRPLRVRNTAEDTGEKLFNIHERAKHDDVPTALVRNTYGDPSHVLNVFLDPNWYGTYGSRFVTSTGESFDCVGFYHPLSTLQAAQDQFADDAQLIEEDPSLHSFDKPGEKLDKTKLLKRVIGHYALETAVCLKIRELVGQTYTPSL